jgi:hypothetical protein
MESARIKIRTSLKGFSLNNIVFSLMAKLTLEKMEKTESFRTMNCGSCEIAVVVDEFYPLLMVEFSLPVPDLFSTRPS